MKKYEKIQQFFEFLEKEFALQICIKDYCGFIPIDKELDQIMQPYLTHTNAFCMYVKQEKKVYWRCLSMIRKMFSKLEKEPKTFFGICHAGLGEYVVPIKSNDNLLGSINVGFFFVEDKKRRFRLGKLCNNFEKLEFEVADKLLREYVTEPKIEAKVLIPMLEVIAEYLASTYEHMLSTHSELDHNKRYRSSNEDIIITHATQVIHDCYSNQLTVGEIALRCHCSESYLSRIFKKRKGINVNTYINKIRVEFSKSYLISTDDSLADISINVGFSDPNYFSRVFSNTIGISPSEFRKRFALKNL